MKLLHTALATVALLAAVACGNKHNEAADAQTDKASVRKNDSFNYLREHIAAELKGTEPLLPFLKDSIVLERGKGKDVQYFKVADKDMWPSFQFSIYAGNKKLYLYNEDKKSVSRTIDLSHTYNDEDIVQCFVKGNVIYTIRWMSNDMICFDLNGHKVNAFHFPDTSREMGCKISAFPSISSFRLNCNNDMAMFMEPHLNLTEKEERLKIMHSKPIALMHIAPEGMELKHWLGSFPKEYIDHYYHESEFNFTNIGDSTIVYLFRIFPRLYVQNIYTGKLQQYPIKGLPENMVNHISEDPNDMQNFSYTTAYELKNDNYTSLAYDEQKKRIYIFRSLGIPPVTDDGSLALNEDMPVLLYVVDAVTHEVIRKINCGTRGDYIWYSRPVIYNNKLYIMSKRANARQAPMKINIYEIP